MDSACCYTPDDYMVYIRCITYNHSKYIKAALEGFALQQTNFPFVCVVIDDCSPDGEQEVIKEWMRNECEQRSIQYYELELAYLYIATHKSNFNCKYAFYLLKHNLRGDERKEMMIAPWRNHSKYEAWCEGDDYWTDSTKLQEQIDFMETHPKYSATSSKASVLDSSVIPIRSFGAPFTKDYTKIQEVVVQRQFHTASVVFRTSSMLNCPYYQKGNWDMFMWCCLLSQGPIHYDEKVTCVYRKQNQGITQTTPKMDWLVLTSKWADILTECFVPKFVKKKYIVRSVTKGVIRTYIQKNKLLSISDKKKLRQLYRHNFAFGNIIYDLKEVLRCIIENVKK